MFAYRGCDVVVVVVVVVVISLLLFYRLVGLVVNMSVSRAADPRFDSRLRRDFSGSSHTSDLTSGRSSGYPARRLA